MESPTPLETLRDLVHGEPSEEAWEQIVELLDAWPSEEDIHVAVDYVASATHWPLALRRTPPHWALWLASSHDAPRLRAVGTVDLSELKLNASVLTKALSDPRVAQARAIDATDLKLGTQYSARFVQGTLTPLLTELSLENTKIGGGGAEMLARADLKSLRVLNIRRCEVGIKGLKALLSAPCLAGLEVLRAGGNKFGDKGALALADSSLRLRELELSNSKLGQEAARKLLASPVVEDVEVLDLSGCGFTESVWAELGQLRLSKLRELRLNDALIPLRGFEALGQLAPNLRTLSLHNAGTAGCLKALLGAPFTSTLEHLDLSNWVVSRADIKALHESTHLSQLRQLIFANVDLSAQQSDVQLAATSLPALRALSLSNTRLSTDALRALAANPVSERLVRLDLTFTQLGVISERANALLELALPALEELELSNNGLRADFVSLVCERQRWPRLRRLGLAQNYLQRAGMEAIMNARHWPALRALNLAGTTLTDASFGDLGEDTLLAQLRELDVSYNDLYDHRLTPLFKNPAAANLRALNVAYCRMSATGAQALQDSPVLHRRVKVAWRSFNPDAELWYYRRYDDNWE